MPIKSILIFTPLLLLTFFLHAQLNENFDDGDFTNNPTWSGDVTSFQVLSGQLNSTNAIASSTFYLSTPSTSATNAQWEIFINFKQATSGTNYMDVFLISDKPDVNNASNGFFIRVGGTPDEISLYRNDAGTSTIIINGTDGRSQVNSSDNIIKIKVTRDASNLWTLTDSVVGASPVVFSEGTATDAAHQTSSYFGISVKQSTASFFGKHYFDNIYTGAILVDNIPPTINSVSVINQNAIDVKYSEAVDQTTAETISNYAVDNGIGNPATATLDVGDHSLLHLTFANSFSNGVQNTLTVNNVKDLANNTIATNSTSTFTYFAAVTAAPNDIIINEIMAAPNGSLGLPNVEYVELYNRSNKSLNLTDWTIHDATGSSGVFPTVTLTPGSFLIVCSTTNVAAMSVYGNAIGVSSFPSLNNTGDDIGIYTNTSLKIDEVIYDETWYHDPNKTSNGYSLERIDYNFPCISSKNWAASAAPVGGTPGQVNSINGVYNDNVPPQILSVALNLPQTVVVYFNEIMDSQTLNVAGNFSIDYGIGIPTSATAGVTSDYVTLQFSGTFQNGIVYHVTVNNLKDCAGNLIATNTTSPLAIAETPVVSDILINEILFNPFTGGSDFVELYNNSEKVFDLSKLKIAERDAATHKYSSGSPAIISTKQLLLFPHTYIALTRDVNYITTQYYSSNPSGIVQSSTLPDFNDAENYVSLENDSALIIDEFRYSEGFQYPLLNSVEGFSLERLSFNRITQDSTNWHSAAESLMATPAYKNSQSDEGVASSNPISIEPETFSPDNDGYNDVLNVHLNFSDPGLTANVQVYDGRGRLVQYLLRNQLIGNETQISWDGINLDHQKSNIGIYILYTEVFSEGGDVKKYKNAFVLAGKFK